MSTRKPVEVLVRAERRRSWTVEQKREIVGESLGPKQTAAEIARKHGITPGQFYTLAAANGEFANRRVGLPSAAVCVC